MHFRGDRILGLTNKTLECLLRIKTEGTTQFYLIQAEQWSTGGANDNPPLLTCNIQHCHAYLELLTVSAMRSADSDCLSNNMFFGLQFNHVLLL